VPEKIKLFLLVPLAVVVAVMSLISLRSPPSVADHANAKPTPTAAAQVTALVVGDSYLAGAIGVTQQRTFGPLTCTALGWLCQYDAQGGTGYAADGHDNDSAFRPYGIRLATDQANDATPDVVVITGGRNDAAEADGATSAKAYLAAVRKAYPTAALVVVAPFWDDSKPPPALLALRDVLKVQASRNRAAFIDPLGAEWITDANAPTYIGSDGTHPTAAGHAFLAQKLSSALREVRPALGL
jgi:lysophospholipase L1-like esterase